MEPKVITKAQQIIDIIAPIDKDRFCMDMYQFGNRCCVLGHINQKLSPTHGAADDIFAFGARALTEKYFLTEKKRHMSIAMINNSPRIAPYTEPEIKDRVMHALNDMVAAGY